MNRDIYRPNQGIMQRYDVLRELGLCSQALGDTSAAKEYETKAASLLDELMEINQKIETQAAGETLND